MLLKDVTETNQHEAEALEAGAGRPRATTAMAVHRAIATMWGTCWGCLPMASFIAIASMSSSCCRDVRSFTVRVSQHEGSLDTLLNRAPAATTALEQPVQQRMVGQPKLEITTVPQDGPREPHA